MHAHSPRAARAPRTTRTSRATRTARAARAAAATVTLALVGAMFVAGPASATTFIAPALPATPTNTPSIPSQLVPGLYIQVFDGMVHVTNSGGSQNFAAGQFGFAPTFVQPPVSVPKNPGLPFTPPPAFQSPAAQLAAQKAAEPAAAASAAAKEAIELAAVAAAQAAEAAADAAAVAANESGALDALNAAEQAAATAQESLGAAREAAERAQNDAAEAVGTQFEQSLRERADALVAEVAAAAETARLALLAQTDAEVAYSTAQADRTSADQHAADAQARAQRLQFDADAKLGVAKTSVAATIPALPAKVPASDEEPVTNAPPALPAGQNMLLAAGGFAPRTSVTFGVYSDPLSVEPVIAGSVGIAEAAFAIPSTFSGSHSLVAIGTGVDGLIRTLRIDITVGPAAADPAAPVTLVPAAGTPATTPGVTAVPVAGTPATTPAAQLAATGTDAALPLGGAALLVAVGAIVLLLRRHGRKPVV